MKAVGRSPIPLTEEQKAIVKEYLESREGYDEIARKHNKSPTTIQYWVTKYRKCQQEDTEKEREMKLLIRFLKKKGIVYSNAEGRGIVVDVTAGNILPEVVEYLRCRHSLQSDFQDNFTRMHIY